MKTTLLLVFAAAGLALFGGCVAEPASYTSHETTKYTLENTEKFVPLDKLTQNAVTCTGLLEPTRDDGRLEVVANIKNRENRRIQVQVNCIFKDDLGFSTGDETPFQTLTLAENSTETVRFTALNMLAKKYTVRVRQAR